MSEEISSKNTKKEILEAYEQLKQQMEAQKDDSPEAQQQEAHKARMVEEAAVKKPDKIMQDMAQLKITLNQSLDQIEESLVDEQKKLSRVREAIQAEEEKLQNVYDIKAEADSLAALINAHKEKKQQLEQEMKEKREAWEKEKKQMEQELKEEKERIQKDRKREEEEYIYNRDQQRKKDEDAYKEKLAQQEKELKEKRQAFEKEIQEREADLKASEEELKELRQKAEAFPLQLEEAVKDKEKEVTDRLTSQFKHEKELLKKEYQGDLNLKDQTIKTLQDKIKDQDNLMNQLYKKVESADKNVKDIVLKAIEGSGRYLFHEKYPENRNYRGEEKKQQEEE